MQHLVKLALAWAWARTDGNHGMDVGGTVIGNSKGSALSKSRISNHLPTFGEKEEEPITAAASPLSGELSTLTIVEVRFIPSIVVVRSEHLCCNKFLTGGGWDDLEPLWRMSSRYMHVNQDSLLFVSAMGLEKGGSYGTFEGQQGFAQHSLGGAYSSGGQQFATSAVPGYPVLQDYPGIHQGSGSYHAAHCPGPEVQSCYHHYEVIIHRPLPFCGLGFGWFLFMMGFFIAVFPWVIGAGLFLFLKHDYRERTGLMACTIAILVLLFVGGVGFHVHMLHH